MAKSQELGLSFTHARVLHPANPSQSTDPSSAKINNLFTQPATAAAMD